MSAQFVLVCWGMPYGDDAPEGQYLASFDVEAYDGRGTAEWTSDISRAMRFDGFMEAMEVWRTQSKVRPLRPDGKPNRPLTAFNVEPRALS